MRYLLLSSCILWLAGCSSAYKNLKPVVSQEDCVQQFQPAFTRALYKAQVDVIGKHLSGILFIKQMPDSSTRLLFTMETGIKFFDFEITKEGQFKIYYIIKQMNRKAVIKTLRKDFELVLMKDIGKKQNETYSMDSLLYYRYTNGKEYDYYITDSSCSQLVSIEKAGRRKKKVEVLMLNYTNGLPDTIGITHHNFDFQIGLKKLEQ